MLSEKEAQEALKHLRKWRRENEMITTIEDIPSELIAPTIVLTFILGGLFGWVVGYIWGIVL